MLASGPWYTSATIMGWTAIAVTVVFGVAGIALGWLGIRRRLLIYIVEWASLLLTNDLESSGAGDIEIRLGDQVVDNPHLVTLTIVSRSHKDIRASDFQKDKPLLFDFGVPIVAAKSFTFKNQQELWPNLMTPGSQGAPSQTIQINPSLIRKGPWGQLHLLTEGPPDLTCESPIADIMVREGNPATSKRIYAAIGILAGCLLFEGGIIANPLLGWPEVAIAIVLLLVATVIGGELVIAWRRRLSQNPPITLNTPLT